MGAPKQPGSIADHRLEAGDLLRGRGTPYLAERASAGEFENTTLTSRSVQIEDRRDEVEISTEEDAATIARYGWTLAESCE